MIQVKRYGFHGTSVKYVVQKASSILRNKHASDREHWNLIIAHLGNGASVTAVYEGKVSKVLFDLMMRCTFALP
jgi:acetate kinase